MARALRIELPGGRYHVTARGNEQRDIYRDDRDRQHFLDLLAEAPDRFGTRLHAYMLMNNHYHLVMETPEGSLSRPMQWINVSYSVWFNRRHARRGHLFQGRFDALVLEDDAALQEVCRYVHLNPLRVTLLGLGKSDRAAQRQGLSPAPSPAVVRERLRRLREWRWSSYRAYAGYATAPEWLYRDVLSGLCGGRNESERQRALRAYTESAVREGCPECPWDRLVGGVVLGSLEFARSLLQRGAGNAREQPSLGKLRRSVSWKEIVRAVEAEKQENWGEFCDRHGDWGRDVALWLGRRMGRLTLAALADYAGGIDYTAAGAAVSRVGQRLKRDPSLRQHVERIQMELSKIEM
jgi:putative transposase